MTRFKKIILATAAILVILLPVGLILGMILSIPPQYSNTFVGELDDKYERLYSIDEPKIVVVGGSSVAFGLESELIEKYTDMPVVNFGLYADLGTKIMLDLSRDAIGEGDIVILAPEMDAQTLSMFFNAKTVLQATDERPDMLRHLRGDDIFATLGALFGHLKEKYGYYVDGAPNPSGVYNGNNFNEYGDLEYERKENVMSLSYDPNKLIELDISILEEAFAEYINDYARACERRGASVYFTYSPMNKAALAPGTTDESIEQFAKDLAAVLDCEIISNIDECILGAGYFYDTNVHLNNAGERVRTLRLLEDIMLATGNGALVTETEPPEPSLGGGMIVVPTPPTDGDGGSTGDGGSGDGSGGSTDGGNTPSDTPEQLDPELEENTELFVYETDAVGNLTVVGLTDAGRSATELTLPLYAKLRGDTQRRAITAIGEGAFSGAAVRKLTVTADSYLESLRNGCFRGASELRELYLLRPYAEDITPPADFAGVHADFKIYVPDNSEYKTEYFWSQVPGISELVIFIEE